jgi:hypothetical protein
MRAVISSSNIDRRKLCAGSARMELGLPDEETEYSAEGTLLHWHDAHPEAERKLTRAQIEVLEKVKRTRERFFEVNRETFGVQNSEPKLFIEREFFLCDENGIPIEHPEYGMVPGHPDRVEYYRDEEVAFIHDSKFGRLPVTRAELNYQLRSYAVCFYELYPCKKIVCAIEQPWLASPDDFHSVVYTEDVLGVAKEELLGIVRACYEPEAELHPSKEACWYCKAKANLTCKPCIEYMESIAKTKINELPIPELEAMADVVALSKSVAEAWEKRMKLVAKTMPQLLQYHELAEP